jgi:hypothetical protein
MSVPGPRFRPCGACAELVPSDTGCQHWKPGVKSGKRTGWVRGRARTTPIPAASPAADLGFLRVLDRGATGTIQ